MVAGRIVGWADGQGETRPYGPSSRLPVSGNAEKLMRLQAQSPAWMAEAVAQREGGVHLAGRAIHRLQEEVPELEPFEPLGLRGGLLLGIDQLELVPPADSQAGAG